MQIDEEDENNISVAEENGISPHTQAADHVASFSSSTAAKQPRLLLYRSLLPPAGPPRRSTVLLLHTNIQKPHIKAIPRDTT